MNAPAHFSSRPCLPRPMRMVLRTLMIAFVLGVASVCGVSAQPTDENAFEPRRVWPAQYPAETNSATRPGTGRPGPGYWQNHADYTIDAELDTSAKKIRGQVEITYTNNSPSALSSIWLHTGNQSSSASSAPSNRMQVHNVEVERKAEPSSSPSTFSTGDRLQVRLQSPVEKRGGTATLRLQFEVLLLEDEVPGLTYTSDGVLYGVGYWHPRVAAYNDQHGWAVETTQIARERHAEYGSFEYSITVPASLIVAGSGTLLNPGDVLTGNQRRRLLQARDSKQKVSIITPGQAGTADSRPQQSGTLTWRFRMNGTRTVAWAASPSFIWSAAKFSRPGTQDGLAMTFYPRSAMGGRGWNRATSHTQKTLSFYSKKLYRYPWNNSITVTAPTGEIGFPGISFCAPSATGYGLFACTVQAQGYNWFPGIVGTNPDRHPWMDHGLRTFMSVLAHRQLYEGEFAPKRDEAYAPGEQPVDRTVARRLTSSTSPILAPPASSTASAPFPQSFKPAYGLVLLRDYILEPKQLEYALRQYVQRWAFRAPSPMDFFHSIEDAAGEDLSWFWRGWFQSSWPLDIGIDGVAYENESPKTGAEVTFTLDRPLPMPVRARVVEADGDTLRLDLPVERWRNGTPQVVSLDTDSRLQTITVDPDRVLPDADLDNNTWTASSP